MEGGGERGESSAPLFGGFRSAGRLIAREMVRLKRKKNVGPAFPAPRLPPSSSFPYLSRTAKGEKKEVGRKEGR